MAAKRTGAIIGFSVTLREHAFSRVFFQTLEVGFHADIFCLAELF
jgi:hypothetical protein